MKPLNAKVAVDRCLSLSETSLDASLLDETLSETLSLLFDERTLDEISWLDRHSSLVIIILFKSSWSTTIKDKIILCESDKLQASLVRFPTHLVYDVETPHEDPFHTLRTLISRYWLKKRKGWQHPTMIIDHITAMLHHQQKHCHITIPWKLSFSHHLMTEHQPVEVFQLFSVDTMVAPVSVPIAIPVKFSHLDDDCILLFS